MESARGPCPRHGLPYPCPCEPVATEPSSRGDGPPDWDAIKAQALRVGRSTHLLDEGAFAAATFQSHVRTLAELCGLALDGEALLAGRIRAALKVARERNEDGGAYHMLDYLLPALESIAYDLEHPRT